jgi:hypothetical protein
MSNSGVIDFPAASPSAWGAIIGWAIFDALTVGNMLVYGDMTSKQIDATDIFRFAAGSVVYTEQ